MASLHAILSFKKKFPVILDYLFLRGFCMLHEMGYFYEILAYFGYNIYVRFVVTLSIVVSGSVLVHSGGVHGGHYYAFIRPTLSDQW